jgi:hypothetical protein
MSEADAALKKVPPDRNRGGEWVQLGDELYRIPPLAFRAIIDLQDRVEALAAISQRPTPEQMDTVAEIVHSAMVRNYTTMTLEQVGEMLDLGNFQDVLAAVLTIGGFKKGGDGSGEAQTAAPTGVPSTSP